MAVTERSSNGCTELLGFSDHVTFTIGTYSASHPPVSGERGRKGGCFAVGRSLDAARLATRGETAAAPPGELPAETVVGVLAFDDAPRWVLRAGSPSEAASALGTLGPSGSYTLLDDALVTA